MACAVAEVGVPEIAPVDALRLRPAGSAGLTVKLVGAPETLGVSMVMAWPTGVTTLVCG